MTFSLRPVFIGWIALVAQLPFQIFFTLWCGGFFGGMLSSTGLVPRGSSVQFLLPGALAFVGVPLVACVGKKLNYGRTEYRFFPDRLEFDEGFFAINRKMIKFKDVKEVTLHKGLLQRLYGLGTIYLSTLATGSAPSNNMFPRLASETSRRTASACATRPIPTRRSNGSRPWSTRRTSSNVWQGRGPGAVLACRWAVHSSL